MTPELSDWQKHLQNLSNEEIDVMMAGRTIPDKAELEVRRNRIESWRENVEKQKENLRIEGLNEEEIKNLTDPIVSFSLGIEEEIQTIEEFYRRKKA